MIILSQPFRLNRYFIKISLIFSVSLLVMLLHSYLLAEQLLVREELILCGIPSDRLDCGCQFKIDEQVCPNLANSSDQQLFIEPLSEGKDVLWLNNGGVEIKLQPTAPNQIMSNPYSPQISRYQNDDLSVEIHSQPSPSTCPISHEDDCEYIDVRATILITPTKGEAFRYNAVGRCGC